MSYFSFSLNKTLAISEMHSFCYIMKETITRTIDNYEVVYRQLYDLCMGLNGMLVHNVLNTCGIVGGGLLLNLSSAFHKYLPIKTGRD